MPTQLPAYPGEGQFTLTFPMGGTQYNLVFTWRDRCAAWYLDVYLTDGTEVAIGRRISPNFRPLLGVVSPNAPAGELWVFGPTDPYFQSDLGTNVVVVWFDASEIPAAVSPYAGLVVT